MAKRDTAVNGALAQLRGLVGSTYAVGDQLPNEKQLADELDVSRGTVREALGVLATEGLVTRRWGVGTFVSPPRPAASLNMSRIQSYRDRVQQGGHTVGLRESSCSLEMPSDAAAAALGLAPGTRAWRVYRLFTVDGIPSAAMTEHIPTVLHGVEVDPTAMTDIGTDLFDMLNGHIAGSVARTATDIAAIVVDADQAKALDVEAGHPVLRAEQLTFDREGTPLAHSISLQRTDLVRMRITR